MNEIGYAICTYSVSTNSAFDKKYMGKVESEFCCLFYFTYNDDLILAQQNHGLLWDSSSNLFKFVCNDWRS